MKHNLKTCVRKAKPFKDILKHVAEKHPNAWENKKREMENKLWIPASEVEKTIEELQNLKQRHMAQGGNKQWHDGFCSAIDKVLGLEK